MPDFLIDTSILVRCLRGIEPSLELTRALSEQGDLHVSALSLLEILADANPKEEKRTSEFLAPFLHVALSDEIAERAARLVRAPSPNSPQLNLAEAVIAATALRHDMTLVTHRSSPLASMPELKILAGT